MYYIPCRGTKKGHIKIINNFLSNIENNATTTQHDRHLLVQKRRIKTGDESAKQVWNVLKQDRVSGVFHSWDFAVMSVS